MHQQVKKAMLFARDKHKGQKYGEKDYFLYHVCGVVDSLKDSINQEYCYGAHKDEILISAYLHDVVEDCDVTLEEISLEFGTSVALYVDCLTKRKGESREDYLERVCTSPVATLIKLHDATQNATQSLICTDLKRFAKYMNYIGVLGKNIEKLSKEV